MDGQDGQDKNQIAGRMLPIPDYGDESIHQRPRNSNLTSPTSQLQELPRYFYAKLFNNILLFNKTTSFRK